MDAPIGLDDHFLGVAGRVPMVRNRASCRKADHSPNINLYGHYMCGRGLYIPGGVARGGLVLWLVISLCTAVVVPGTCNTSTQHLKLRKCKCTSSTSTEGLIVSDLDIGQIQTSQIFLEAGWGRTIAAGHNTSTCSTQPANSALFLV